MTATPAPSLRMPAAASPLPGTAESPPARPPKPPTSGSVSSFDLEEALGGRMFVWVGAIALALAGIFLVKYTVDQGLLNPPIRIALGVLFGVSLLGSGEWLRRESARIAGALSAAGIAVLFASFLAATNLYHLVPEVVGFALMALTTATAVGLSLRQGQLVAFVGLVGGFMTPYLIQADSAAGHPAPLFTYLLLLQAGLVVVTRRRGWDVLAVLTLAAGQVWVLLWLAGHLTPDHAPWLYGYLLATAVLFLSLSFTRAGAAVDADASAGAAAGAAAGAWSDARLPLALGWASVLASLFLMSVIGSLSRFRPMDWLFLGLLGAGCIALARLRAEYEKLPWLAVLVTGLLLLGWSSGLADADRVRFLSTVFGFALLFAGGAYVCLWGAARPAVWSAMAAAAGFGLFVVGFVGEEWLDKSGSGWFVSPVPWGLVALALAVVAIAAAVPLARQRALLPEGDLALAVMAAAATGFLSWAVPLELRREWLAVGWALEVPALAWIALRLQAPVLRKLAWPVGALVAARLLLNPGILNYPIGNSPVLNWLVYGYGIPTAAFALAAWYGHRAGDVRFARAGVWGALLLGWAFLTLEVRQFFHPGELGSFAFGTREAGAYGTLWLGYSLALLATRRRWPVEAFGAAGRALAQVALAEVILVAGLLLNPLLMSSEKMGSWPVLNWLLFIYGLPAAMGLLVVAFLRREGDNPARTELRLRGVLVIQSLVLAWICVSLEVRQLFHDALLTSGALRWGTPLLENATFALVWLICAGMLLYAYRRWRWSDVDTGGWAFLGLGLLQAFFIVLLLANPDLGDQRVGTLPFFNHLLYAVGLPALLCFWILREVRRQPQPIEGRARLVFAAGLTLGFSFLTLEVRQLFHGALLNQTELRFGTPFLERASYAVLWLWCGAGSFYAYRRRRTVDLDTAGWVMAGLGLLQALLNVTLLNNPAWKHEPVGDLPLLNGLLFAYGLTAIACLWIARELRRQPVPQEQAARVVSVAGLLLSFTLVTLEVRQLFHGTFLDGETFNNMERYAYSLAWVLFGTVLLVAGIARRSHLARYGSLAVMVLAVGKVFLYDTQSLGGLYRVFSFLGLGLCLLFLAWLYQRFVFRPEVSDEPTAA